MNGTVILLPFNHRLKILIQIYCSGLYQTLDLDFSPASLSS